MAKDQKLIDRAKEQMEPGEQIVAAVLGTYETKIMGSDSVRNGVLIATDRRIVFYAKKMTGYELESYPYDSISSIDQGKNMMGHTVTFYASGNKIDVKWIKDLEKLSRFMDIAKLNIHARTTMPHNPPPPPSVPATPAPPPPMASPPDVMAQLKSLGDLRDSGVLTEDEFAAKKAELLKRV